MPAVAVSHCLSDFQGALRTSLAWLNRSRDYRIERRSGALHMIGARATERLAALTLLEMHLAWEDCVESVFVRYLCGALAPSGRAPSLVGPRFSSMPAAMRALLGNRRYLRWTGNDITDRAKLFFVDGEPFASAVGYSRQYLEDVCTVRNAIAHRSDSARNEFRALVRREYGYNPRGLNPGRFLLSPGPAGKPPGVPPMQQYYSVLMVVGRMMVP